VPSVTLIDVFSARSLGIVSEILDGVENCFRFLARMKTQYPDGHGICTGHTG